MPSDLQDKTGLSGIYGTVRFPTTIIASEPADWFLMVWRWLEGAGWSTGLIVKYALLLLSQVSVIIRRQQLTSIDFKQQLGYLKVTNTVVNVYGPNK